MLRLAQYPTNTHSLEEVQQYERWARQQQALVFRQMAVGVGRGIGRAVASLAGLYQALGRSQRRRVAIRELSALDDYILNDMGLTRGTIRAAVDGLLDSEQRRGATPRVVEVARAGAAPSATPAAAGQDSDDDVKRAA